LFFLLGAFVSSLIMEWISRYKSQLAIVIPVFIEIGILLYISFADSLFPNQQLPDVQFACMLLFAMGLQNALVTRVSQSIVRTTHLTGLFTDLGIDLSQVFFIKEESRRNRLFKNIFLKLSIILFFFLGGIVGGMSYMKLELKTLILPVILLFFALRFDQL